MLKFRRNINCQVKLLNSPKKNVKLINLLENCESVSLNYNGNFFYIIK